MGMAPGPRVLVVRDGLEWRAQLPRAALVARTGAGVLSLRQACRLRYRRL